jgi:hypothetical protein
MKEIKENELYENFSQFLKSRGVELTAGSYARVLQRGCSLLTDAVNLGQKGMHTVGTELNEKLDQLRNCVHEATAPKTQAPPTQASPPITPGPAPAKPAAESVRPPSKAKKKARKSPPRRPIKR